MEFWAQIRSAAFYKQKSRTDIYVDATIFKIENLEQKTDIELLSKKSGEKASFKLQVDRVADYIWLASTDFAVFRVNKVEKKRTVARNSPPDLLITEDATKCDLFREPFLADTKYNILAQ
jgi:hypothetical protein